MGKQKTNEEKQERKKNWKEYWATVEDIQNFVMDRLMLRHNVITRRVEYRLPASYEHEATDWQPLSDRVVNSLWSELSLTKQVRAQDIYRVLESDFVPEYNPFAFYLEHLPPWDGDDHILAMSVSVGVKGEVADQMLFAQYLKKWLVGMVAGWVDDSVVNNVILVLIGEDDVVQLRAAAGAAPLLLHEDEREPHGSRRPADAGAVRAGVLRGAGHHAALGAEPAEGGGDDADDRRACGVCPLP